MAKTLNEKKQPSWKKYFHRYQGSKPAPQSKDAPAGGQYKFSSWLPEVYEGTSYRLERYLQYEQMDQDSEINAALDIIAEFSTQQVEGSPFDIEYLDDVGQGETAVIMSALQSWINLNEFDKRLWRLFRNTIKFGDQFLIRDPQTWKLFWVNPMDVVQIAMDPDRKDIVGYFIKDIQPNFQDLVASDTQNSNYYKGSYQGAAALGTVVGGMVPNPGNSAAVDINTARIQAEHVVHISLTEGWDQIWPFGPSVLEPVFKTFKQKEMLEDAILIYRIQRAPERRIFYVDVGDMGTVKAMQYLEKVKNEIHQKRIPNRTGGSHNIVDSTYNPQSMLEDLWFAQTSDGRGSKVDTLPGGSNLGEIDDLKYFQMKLFRGLRIPASYLPTGTDEGTVTVQDGKLNTAFIQEFRFSEYCRRLQSLVAPTLDREFKRYVKHMGFQVDSSNFKLVLNEPMNFSRYRQLELEATSMAAFRDMAGIKQLSVRFKMKKYLGLSEDEIYENEELLAEELGMDIYNGETEADEPPKLSAVGLGGAGIPDFGGGGEGPPPDDLGGEEGDFGGEEGASPISGDEGGGDLGADAPPAPPA